VCQVSWKSLKTRNWHPDIRTYRHTSDERKISLSRRIWDFARFARSVNYFHHFIQCYFSGPLTIPGAVEGLAYISTKHNDDKRNRPDMELIFASGSLTSDRGHTVRGGIGVSQEIYEDTFRFISKSNYLINLVYVHQRTESTCSYPNMIFFIFSDPAISPAIPLYS